LEYRSAFGSMGLVDLWHKREEQFDTQSATGRDRSFYHESRLESDFFYLHHLAPVFKLMSFSFVFYGFVFIVEVYHANRKLWWRNCKVWFNWVWYIANRAAKLIFQQVVRRKKLFFSNSKVWWVVVCGEVRKDCLLFSQWWEQINYIRTFLQLLIRTKHLFKKW